MHNKLLDILYINKTKISKKNTDATRWLPWVFVCYPCPRNGTPHRSQQWQKCHVPSYYTPQTITICTNQSTFMVFWSLRTHKPKRAYWVEVQSIDRIDIIPISVTFECEVFVLLRTIQMVDTYPPLNWTNLQWERASDLVTYWTICVI